MVSFKFRHQERSKCDPLSLMVRSTKPVAIALAFAFAAQTPYLRTVSASEMTAPGSDMAAAFRQVYGAAGQASRRLTDEHGQRATYVFRPAALVPTGDRLALVSLGDETSGCHACAGMIAVHYLRKTAAGFKPVGAWPTFRAGTVYGKATDGWTLRDDLTANPVFMTKAGGTWFGCTTSNISGIELAPDGPKLVIENIQTRFETTDFDGSKGTRRINGQIVNPVKGEGFSVPYWGSANFTVNYRLEGGRFRPVSKKQRLPNC